MTYYANLDGNAIMCYFETVYIFRLKMLQTIMTVSAERFNHFKPAQLLFFNSLSQTKKQAGLIGLKQKIVIFELPAARETVFVCKSFLTGAVTGLFWAVAAAKARGAGAACFGVARPIVLALRLIRGFRSAGSGPLSSDSWKVQTA